MTKKTLFSPPSSEITPPEVWNRRKMLAAGAALLSTPLIGQAQNTEQGTVLTDIKKSSVDLGKEETPTSKKEVTSYNNFYEFGPNKDSPVKLAHRLETRPWTITVEGEVKNPKTFSIEDILGWGALEERVYRLRCVETWSAVIPWVGLPFTELLKRVELTGNAKFVEFVSLADEKQMPYVRVPFLRWPYRESLRLDEAMNPLTILAVGMYGEVMPKQNGAPIRLVVPWKYGFKSAKSIVRIRFLEKQPETVWTETQSGEYGFYANVNPDVSHPRWRQDSERRLGSFFKQKTLMFNGYADHVAHLYQGMDLRVNY